MAAPAADFSIAAPYFHTRHGVLAGAVNPSPPAHRLPPSADFRDPSRVSRPPCRAEAPVTVYALVQIVNLPRMEREEE